MRIRCLFDAFVHTVLASKIDITPKKNKNKTTKIRKNFLRNIDNQFHCTSHLYRHILIYWLVNGKIGDLIYLIWFCLSFVYNKFTKEIEMTTCLWLVWFHSFEIGIQLVREKRLISLSASIVRFIEWKSTA